MANKLSNNIKSLNDSLVTLLKPFAEPVAISFHASSKTTKAVRMETSYPAPNEYGRTGQVPAGCVFWIHGSKDVFLTEATDHANCSVGSYTHGFLTAEEVSAKDDVAAVIEAGWFDSSAMDDLPRVTKKPKAIVYGPLSESSVIPDVVLLRINGLALMRLKSVFPDMPIEGKPQCHIVAIAYEQKVVAASVGCALSRSRTGMGPEEMVCVIPGSRLVEVIESLKSTAQLDRAVAMYASSDAKRFDGWASK